MSLSAGGSFWLDDISLDPDDIKAMRGGSGSEIACGGDMRVNDMHYTGTYEGLELTFNSDGVNPPDVVGYACDGHETIVSNPLASGWYWDGPGERPIGIRQRAMQLMRDKCGEGLITDDITHVCLFMAGWNQGAAHQFLCPFCDDGFDAATKATGAIVDIGKTITGATVGAVLPGLVPSGEDSTGRQQDDAEEEGDASVAASDSSAKKEHSRLSWGNASITDPSEALAQAGKRVGSRFHG